MDLDKSNLIFDGNKLTETRQNPQQQAHNLNKPPKSELTWMNLIHFNFCCLSIGFGWNKLKWLGFCWFGHWLAISSEIWAKNGKGVTIGLSLGQDGAGCYYLSLLELRRARQWHILKRNGLTWYFPMKTHRKNPLLTLSVSICLFFLHSYIFSFSLYWSLLPILY